MGIQNAREDDVKDVSSYWITFRTNRILEFERGSARSHPVENLLGQRACCKRDNVMNVLLLYEK
jgi:hypothetical protein